MIWTHDFLAIYWDYVYFLTMRPTHDGCFLKKSIDQYWQMTN